MPMIYLGNGMYSDSGPYICHHGIKGMHWGVRKNDNLPKKHRRLKAYNLDKWGKDANHNSLFVTGVSGSGKSFLALDLAKKHNAEVLHLDLYYEQFNGAEKDKAKKFINKDFMSYLKKNFKGPSKVPKSGTKAFGKWCDEFERCVNSYSKELYKKKKKLIVEGIQIFDDGFMQDKSFYKDKPVIVMKTNTIKSYLGASVRDSDNLKSFMSNTFDRERFGWYKDSNKSLKDLQYKITHYDF